MTPWPAVLLADSSVSRPLVKAMGRRWAARSTAVRRACLWTRRIFSATWTGGGRPPHASPPSGVRVIRSASCRGSLKGIPPALPSACWWRMPTQGPGTTLRFRTASGLPMLITATGTSMAAATGGAAAARRPGRPRCEWRRGWSPRNCWPLRTSKFVAVPKSTTTTLPP